MGKDNQVFAATTNGTFASQYFGITFGTSNCLDEKTSNMLDTVDTFVRVNKVALAADIAKGQGETVAALSTLVGCSDGGHFASALQKNFSTIYPSHNVETMQVTDSILGIVTTDRALASNCQI
jgi:hypothetical protein